MIIATLETLSFTFTTKGSTIESALDAMRQLWNERLKWSLAKPFSHFEQRVTFTSKHVVIGMIHQSSDQFALTRPIRYAG